MHVSWMKTHFSTLFNNKNSFNEAKLLDVIMMEVLYLDTASQTRHNTAGTSITRNQINGRTNSY